MPHSFLKRQILCIKDVGPIEAGSLAYCFLEEGDFFRIYLYKPVLGMNEYKILEKFKGHFKVT